MERTDVSGGWVVLRDPKQVPERLRRPLISMTAKSLNTIEAAKAENKIDADTIDFYSEFNDLLAVALIDSWSFADTVSVDNLLDLPAASYDAIRNLVSPLVTSLMPDFSVSPDPKAITES